MRKKMALGSQRDFGTPTEVHCGRGPAGCQSLAGLLPGGPPTKIAFKSENDPQRFPSKRKQLRFQ